MQRKLLLARAGRLAFARRDLVGRHELFGEAHHVEREQPPARPKKREARSRSELDLGQRDALGVVEHRPQQLVAADVLAPGADPVALLDVREVDLERVDELDDLDHPRRVLAFELGQLLAREEGVFALGDLVALADFVPPEISTAFGAAPHQSDARAALLVKLVKLGGNILQCGGTMGGTGVRVDAVDVSAVRLSLLRRAFT